jgi:cell division ATPase FtsA
MGFLFTSKKNKKKTAIAIFDIGSGSVGGAIVQLPNIEGELPTIIKSIRTDIISSEINNFDILLENMLRALNVTSQSLIKNNSIVIKETMCVLASPWYLSETKVIKIEKESPFVFTENQANELFKKEVNNLSEVYKKKYDSLDIPELIESLIMGVSLDGQKTDKPIGKKCKSVELNLLVTLSPTFLLDKIRENISKTFHHTPIRFSSFVVSSYIAIRDKYISTNSYILIDIGGETTDISIMIDNILKYSTSFPEGKKTFFRYISKYKAIELRDAEELFKLYTSDNISFSHKSKTDHIFTSLETMWHDNFIKCFNNLTKGIVLPKVVFLTVDNDIKKWILKIIEKEEYIQSKIGHKFDILTLEGNQFLDMCDVRNSACDPFLMIEAISVMRKKGK